MTNEEFLLSKCPTPTDSADLTCFYDELCEYQGSHMNAESFSRLCRKVAQKSRDDNGKSLDEEVFSSKPEVILHQKNMGNVLFIGDLHLPFERKGYLEFCMEMRDKHDCNTIIFAGDILDSHMSSYHESSPDASFSAGGELNEARRRLKNWYIAFPKAHVCIGNHDSISNRKAFTAGLSTQWIKSISEVLETPNWYYSDEFVFDHIQYLHGIGGSAGQRAKNELMSVCQGHLHSKSYIEYSVGAEAKIFAMQIGAGIDDKSYAFAYAKHFPKSHVNVGIIKDNGKLPLLEYMDLDRVYS